MPNQCLSDGDDSNSNLMAESTPSQSHSNRNFVITPPQTESAQILLSLAACSYSQKQYLNPGLSDGMVTGELAQNGAERLIDHQHNIHGNLLFDEPPFVLPAEPITSSNQPNSMMIDSSAPPHPSLQHQNMADSLAAGIVDFIDADGAVERKPNGVAEQPAAQSVDCAESLLAKLLTRDNQNCARKTNGSALGGARYENLYDVVEPPALRPADTKNVPRVAVASTTFSHSAPMPATSTVCGVDLPPGIILECPFLIETTNGGYVDLAADPMLNPFESDIFAAHPKNTVKIIPKEEVVPLEESSASMDAFAGQVALLPPLRIDEQPAGDAVLERIRQDTADELKDDPEAVVLTRVTEDGRLETFVLSSADVKALQLANDQRRQRRRAGSGASTPSATHTDYESPLSSCGEAPVSLITRIVQFDAAVDNAISKLPFKKSSRPPSSLSVGSVHSAVGANCANETLLAEVAFDEHRQAQTDHHHENMFEELDNQFMSCSIEHMQRDFVAYEEASKNETQLEHNYYANALKDEDEECVTISAGENYMMLLEQPLTNGNGLPEKGKGGAVSYHRHIIGASDVCLNNVAGEKEPAANSRRNGLVIATCAAEVSSTTSAGGADKSAFNGKADLIVNKDALMSSVMAPTAGGKRLANGTPKNGVPQAKSRAVSRAAGAAVLPNELAVNMLPFRSVKNTSSEKKPRRTYKRKAAAESRSSTSLRRKKENTSLNGDHPFVDSNLVEEIVVDEIS